MGRLEIIDRGIGSTEVLAMDDEHLYVASARGLERLPRFERVLVEHSLNTRPPMGSHLPLHVGWRTSWLYEVRPGARVQGPVSS